MGKRTRTAAQTAVLMALLTLVSKLLGFVREMVMAGFFGVSYVVDAYSMAQAIPSIIFAGIFGSVATAYMPLFSEKVENEGPGEGSRFTSHIINILAIASILSSIVGLLLSDQIVAIFASGFEGQTAELTSFFVKVTFSYTLFTSVSGVLESFLQYKNTFLPQIIVGYTQNFLVFGTIIFSAFTSEYFLVFGLLLAYVVRLLLLSILCKNRGLSYSFSMKHSGKVIKKISILAVPVFIGNSISQINLFVDKTLASGLAEGSVAALNYANLLNSLVMGLTVSILTIMIYPRLAQANALEDNRRFSEIAEKGFTLIFMIALPFSLGAILYGKQIVQIVYERGAFDHAATVLTGTAYICYSIGLLFLALNTLLTQMYYSKHNMRTPMIFAGICVIINIVFNLILIRSMAHNGLALATSISAICNTILLYIGIKRNYKNIRPIKGKRKLILIAASAIIAVGASYVIYVLIISLLSKIIFMRIVQIGIAVAAAGVIYLVLLKLFKIEELELLKSIVKR